jgi:glycosyltransferase involved in cell wall biosynthesis
VSRRLRVSCFGSVFYRIGIALQEHADFDLNVWFDDRAFALNTAYRDETVMFEAPWIHVEPLLDARAHLFPWRAPATERLRGADVVLSSESGPLFAQFVDSPSAFLPVGGDLTVTPFPRRSRFRYESKHEQLGAAIIGYWQRRGIRKADEIWVTPFAPYQLALDRLGVAEKRSTTYMPIAIDTDLFRDEPGARARAAAAFPEVAAAGDFVVFHPSRLMVDPHPFLIETGQWKRNEVVIQAFARFAAESPGDPVLLLADQEYSPGRAAADAMIRELDIADRVVWARAEGKVGLSWRQMADLYVLSDVVLDDFGAGWFGMVVMEGASTSRPVITHIDQAVMHELYGEHPFIEAVEPDDVARELLDLRRDSARRARLGAEGRAWAEGWHSPKAIAARYAPEIERLARSR